MDSNFLSQWQCVKCKGYIKNDPKKIKKGDRVYFGFAKVDFLNERRDQLQVGTVLKRNKNILSIYYKNNIYNRYDNAVYPIFAPALMLYNMLWICEC